MKNLFANQVVSIFKKDLKSELRAPDHFFSVLLFGVLLLLLFSFGLGAEADLMKKVAPGLFWLAVLFSSILTLEHSFRRETEDEQWEGLLLLGIRPRALYLGKFFSNLVIVLLFQITLLPLMAALFDVSLKLPLLLVIFLGSAGIAGLGTAYAAIAASLREGQALLPLLLFPMLVPVLLAAVEVTRLSLLPDPFGQQKVWWQLLLLFDTIFILGSLLAAGVLFDRS